jgi:K+-sensing histidine kinase KdpD
MELRAARAVASGASAPTPPPSPSSGSPCWCWPGVPPADRERIFERFTQLDSGATRRAGGVGLGLYIARQLANAQGGELLMTDPAPTRQGARFELRLPMAELAFRRPG